MSCILVLSSTADLPERTLTVSRGPALLTSIVVRWVRWVGGATTAAKMSAKVAKVPLSLCFGPKVNQQTVGRAYKLPWYIPAMKHTSVPHKLLNNGPEFLVGHIVGPFVAGNAGTQV